MVKKNPRAGYSLMEVLVVVAILGIMSGVGANVILQTNRFFLLTRTRGDLQREARSSMYVITRELRQAVSTSIVIDRQSATQPFYSRISFTTIDGRSFSFYQNGNKLIQTAGTNNSTLSSHVQYMAFSFPRSDDLTILSVSMTLQEAIYQGRSKALHMASEKVQVMN